MIDNPNVGKIKDRFLIKAIYDKKIEWFRIDNVTKSSDENGEILSVHAYSLGIELRDKTVIFIDEMFKDVNYMLNLCLSNTLWSVGEIDPDIEFNDGLKVYRSFDLTEVNKLDFLYTIAQTFKGIIVWDTVNRIVNLKTQDHVGNNNGLRISYGKYMKSMNKESNSNEMVTRLVPMGRDGLTINSVSPTGLGYIDDYSYFMYPFQRDENKNVIQSSDYMSDDLCHALLDYNELLSQNEKVFKSLLEKRNSLNKSLLEKQADKVKYNIQMAQILDSIDVEKANERDFTKLEQQRLELQQLINAKQVEIEDIESQLNNNQNEITSLQKLLSTENNFTSDQIMELNTYIIEKTWSNDNITNAEDLLKEAKREFEELRKPQTVFSIDIVNFTQILEGQKDWGKLNIGDTIYIYHERLNENLTAKITEIDVNFDDKSVNITITNTQDILTDEEKFYERLKQVDTTTISLNNNKYRWKDSTEKVSEIEKVINEALDATKREIVAGVNNSVKISSRGIQIIDSEDPNRMIILQNSVLALSEDGGNTWKTAIKPDRIVAERIQGLLGEFVKLRAEQILVNPDGSETTIGGKINDFDEKLRDDLRLEEPLPSSLRLNRYGVNVDDDNGNNRVRLGQYADGKYGLLIRDKTGKVTMLDEEGMLQTWQEGRTDNVDSNNPLVLYLYTPPETRVISKAILRFKLLPFRAYSKGTESGGGIYTSTESGGGTYTSTESGGGGIATSLALNWEPGDNGHDHGIPNGLLLSTADGGSVGWVKSGQHSHQISIPSHTHLFSIPNHYHWFSLPEHIHDIKYGIYTSTSATNISIYINSTNVTYELGGMFTTDQNNLDITKYIKIGQWNRIELNSSRLGRIDASCFIQAFVGM